MPVLARVYFLPFAMSFGHGSQSLKLHLVKGVNCTSHSTTVTGKSAWQLAVTASQRPGTGSAALHLSPTQLALRTCAIPNSFLQDVVAGAQAQQREVAERLATVDAKISQVAALKA